MATSRVTFGEWLPDQPGVLGALTNAKNCYPKVSGYGPFPSEANYSNAAAENLNSVVAAKSLSGTTQVFAGSETKLFKLNGTDLDLDDVSATTYTSTTKWRYTQFGNRLIAANGANTLQAYDLTTTGNFATLASAAPKAKFVTVVRDFVAAAHLDSNGFRVQWSGINDETVWTTTSTSQSDYQDIPDGGDIQGITGGEFGIVLLERSIVRMSYVGTPLIFQFDNIARNLGCYEANSVIQWQGITYFLADDGFYACNGQQVERIGAEKVNRYFFKDLEESLLDKISAAVDPSRNLIMWCYPSVSDGYKILIYHVSTKRWSYAATTVNGIATSSTLSATMEGLDTYSASIDALQTSLDARVWMGGKINLVGYKDAKILTFSGSAKTATIDTSDIEAPDRKTMVTLVRPVVDDGSASVAIASRQLLSEQPTFGSYTAADSENRIGLRSLGRYHRLSVQPSGNWSSAIGVDVDIQPAGMR